VSGSGAQRALRIGLTGPIGCGKSTVAGWLAARGAAVVDADLLAREAVEPGQPALAAITAEFGPEVLDADGRLDRGALGRIVFGDEGALRRLEVIMSPAVRPRIDAALAAAESTGSATGARLIVLEAIRLVEAGYAVWCDEVWLIVCRPDEQRARLMIRGMTHDDAEARIAAQEGLERRVAPHATRVVDTSGSTEATETLVGRLLEEALEAHGRRGRSDHRRREAGA
jgi:dephospho-CoA kinase